MTASAAELTHPAALALRSLADHPCRATVSGLSNSPCMAGSYGPADLHKHLVELEQQGLALERLGRWRLTAKGTKRATRA